MDPHDAPRKRPGKAAAHAARRCVLVLLAAACIGAPAGTAPAEDDTPEEAKSKDRYVARFERAQSLMGRGSDVEAEKLLSELIAERPNEAAVHHALAVVLQFRRRGEEAATEFATAVKLAPDDPVIRRDCGLHLLALGRATEAETQLARAHVLWPKDLDTLLGHASALRALGRADAAEKTYREAVAAEPNSVDAAAGLAACLVTTHPEEALALVKPAPGRWVDVLLVRGLAQETLGHLDDASRELAEAARAAPPGPAGAVFLRDIAEGLSRCGTPAQAEDAATRWCAAELVDGRPSSRASFSLALSRAAAGRNADALAALDASAPPAKEATDVRSRVAFFRAAVLLRAGRRDDATKAFEELAASKDATFERAAARRVLGRASAEELAAEATKADDAVRLANDREWAESLAAELRGDAAEAARHRDAAAKAGKPTGEYPGPLVRPAPAPDVAPSPGSPGK